MKQYDVYENPERATAGFAPYPIILSSHLLDLKAVIFAPLLNDRSQKAGALEVSVTLANLDFIVSLTDLASVDPARLRRHAGSLAAYEDEIRRGLERIFSGF